MGIFLPSHFPRSTISTLLHDKINPKDCQVLSLGDSGFLQFFRVVSSDYGKPRFPLFMWQFFTFHGSVFWGRQLATHQDLFNPDSAKNKKLDVGKAQQKGGSTKTQPTKKLTPLKVCLVCLVCLDFGGRFLWNREG